MHHGNQPLVQNGAVEWTHDVFVLPEAHGTLEHITFTGQLTCTGTEATKSENLRNVAQNLQ